MRILEEALARHRKELDVALGGVVVERRRPAFVERGGEPLLRRRDPREPCRAVAWRQRGYAVDVAVERVEKVGELVDHHAPRAVAEPAAVHHPRPRQRHAAPGPRLADPRLLPRELAAPGEWRRAGHEVVAGIDEQRFQRVEPLAVEAERHDRRLGGDADPHLVADHEPPAALEPLLREKHRDPAAAGFGLGHVEPLPGLHATAKDVVPGRREGLLGDRVPPTGAQERQQHPGGPAADSGPTAAAPARGASAA